MTNNQRSTFLTAEFFLNYCRALTFIYVSVTIILDKEAFHLLAVLGAVEVASLFIGPIISGYFVDKLGSKIILMSLVFTSMLLPVIFLSLMLYDIQLEYICFFVSILSSVISPLVKIAIFSLTPYLHDKKNNGKSNSKLVIAMQTGQLAGLISSPIFTAQINYVSFVILFSLIQFVAFIMFYYSLSNIDKSQSIVATSSKSKRESSTVLQNISLLTIIISATDLILVGAFNFGIVLIIGLFFEGSAFWLSFIEALLAITSITLAYLISANIIRTQIFFVIFTPIAFTGMFIFPVIGSLSLFLVFCALFAATQTISNITWKKYIHDNIHEKFWGRVTMIRGCVTAIIIQPIMYFLSGYSNNTHYMYAFSFFISAGIFFFILNAAYLTSSKFKKVHLQHSLNKINI